MPLQCLSSVTTVECWRSSEQGRLQKNKRTLNGYSWLLNRTTHGAREPPAVKQNNSPSLSLPLSFTGHCTDSAVLFSTSHRALPLTVQFLYLAAIIKCSQLWISPSVLFITWTNGHGRTDTHWPSTGGSLSHPLTPSNRIWGHFDF